MQVVGVDGDARFIEACVVRIGEAVAAARGDHTNAEIGKAVGRDKSWASRLMTNPSAPLPNLEQIARLEEFLGLTKGHLLRAAGLVDDVTSVRDAIRSDPALSAKDRAAVLTVYDLVLGNPERSSHSSESKPAARPKTRRS